MKENGARPRVEILAGNIVHLQCNAVPTLDYARDAIGAAFAFLHRTDALIIDARNNHGGDPDTVALYLSYLSEGPPYLINLFQNRPASKTIESN